LPTSKEQGMFHFQVTCGKDKVVCKLMFAKILCVTYKKRNYLIEYSDKEQAWLLKLGKMDATCFSRICEAIEEHIINQKAA
jgi:hypothetical protein